MVIDFFTDATLVNTVPDSRADLKTIIKGIKSGLPYKMGTEKIFRKFPELLDGVAPDLAKFNKAFGDYFASDLIGLLLTLPVFMAGGVPAPTEGTGHLLASHRLDFFLSYLGLSHPVTRPKRHKCQNRLPCGTDCQCHHADGGKQGAGVVTVGGVDGSGGEERASGREEAPGLCLRFATTIITVGATTIGIVTPPLSPPPPLASRKMTTAFVATTIVNQHHHRHHHLQRHRQPPSLSDMATRKAPAVTPASS
jgi:hypothetical protein